MKPHILANLTLIKTPSRTVAAAACVAACLTALGLAQSAVCQTQTPEQTKAFAEASRVRRSFVTAGTLTTADKRTLSQIVRGPDGAGKMMALLVVEMAKGKKLYSAREVDQMVESATEHATTIGSAWNYAGLYASPPDPAYDESHFRKLEASIKRFIPLDGSQRGADKLTAEEKKACLAAMADRSESVRYVAGKLLITKRGLDPASRAWALGQIERQIKGSSAATGPRWLFVKRVVSFRNPHRP